MKVKLLYVLALMFTLSTYNATAQSKRKQHAKLVNFKENVNAPLTANELTKLKEVYADKLDEYILNRPQKLKHTKHLLRNRIEIIEDSKLVAHKGKYQLLSAVGLYNDYNKNLVMDTSYNPETFNVLKYRVRIHGYGSSIYRIDNTNYFIIIKSQHQ